MTATADLGFAQNIDAHGDRLAVVSGSTRITYRELADRVSTVADRLGTTRRLVLLASSNDIDSLVAYLAALRGGHPVLLAAPSQVGALTEAYDPDVVINDGWDFRRAGTAHELHPDLALLLSTSGTTGSPKLVRISADSLRANAAAIATYLDIRPTDRAITSLPMHYCYGLSVVNSNLLRGAGIVLTDRSVVDPEFWRTVRNNGVTSLHGVPHTFDLLDRVGFARMELPSLRYVTQAGGRMDPARVVELARLGQRRGWRLFVMYGQTEATARMAYLPPDLALDNPSAIGVPIPGGEFHVDDGELVYSGPNVMMGYAESSADLALGRTVTELRTGDLARRTSAGLYEIVGRKSRFLKLHGLRVDLDRVERVLGDEGITAACAGTDDELVVAVRGKVSARRVTHLVRDRFGLRAVRVHRVDEFPRLANGKLDYQALGKPAVSLASVRQVFAEVLGLREVADDATFVGLGGDSLCYVQMSVELERVLGQLPENWPTTPVVELEKLRSGPQRVPMVETNIVLRAIAIVLVVGSHIKLFEILGGAHLLLVLAGWNFARFLLPGSPGRIARSAALIAVPSALWLTFRVFTTDDVNWWNVLLVNNFVRTGAVGYWFVEVLVHTLLATAILFAIPAVRRLERAHGFTFAAILLGATLLLHLVFNEHSSFDDRNMTTHGAVWFFVLGWLAQRAVTARQKWTVAVLGLLLVPGTLDDWAREGLVLAGFVLLLALARVPVPRPAVPVVSLVASASLYIYLTHYAVFPLLLTYLPPPVVVVLSIAFGVVAWQCTRLLSRRSPRCGR